MRRIEVSLEQEILNSILSGYRYADIQLMTGVAVSTIKKIKARNRVLFERAREIDIAALDIEAERMSRVLILEQLERTERNLDELDKADALYGRGEISRKEYARRKHGLPTLSLRELGFISGYM